MPRFSPSYRPRKQFTLHEGVQNAAQALLGYDQMKRDRRIEDEKLGREEEAHERRGRTTDEYIKSQEFYRDRSKAGDFYDRGIVYGDGGASPGQAIAPGETGGLPNVRGMPTIEGESVDPGFARPPGRNPDPSMARAPGRNPDPGMVVPSPDDVGGGGSLADMVRQRGMEIVGSGMKGDWNSQFLQADGAVPIPGTDMYVLPKSESERRAAAERDQLAALLAQSEPRTGFAGEAGSPERTTEAQIQARVGAEKPLRPGSQSGRSLTPYQQLNIAKERAAYLYEQLLTSGMSRQEALAEVQSRVGVLPDFGATRDLGQDLADPYNDFVDRMEPRSAAEDLVVQLRAQGYTVSEIERILHERSQPISNNPLSPMVADTAKAFLRGKSYYETDEFGDPIHTDEDPRRR